VIRRKRLRVSSSAATTTDNNHFVQRVMADTFRTPDFGHFIEVWLIVHNKVFTSLLIHPIRSLVRLGSH
jgi:hypothetical protein